MQDEKRFYKNTERLYLYTTGVTRALLHLNPETTFQSLSYRTTPRRGEISQQPTPDFYAPSIPLPGILREAEDGVGALLAVVAADGLPPHVRAPSDDALGRARKGRGGTHVEVEDGLAGGLGLPRVVVDHVAHFLLLAVDLAGDEPVVSIERGLGSTGIMLVLSYPLSP